MEKMIFQIHWFQNQNCPSFIFMIKILNHECKIQSFSFISKSLKLLNSDPSTYIFLKNQNFLIIISKQFMIKNETFHLHDKTIHVKMNQPLLNSDFSTNSKNNTDLQTYFNIFHDKKTRNFGPTFMVQNHRCRTFIHFQTHLKDHQIVPKSKFLYQFEKRFV